MQANTRYSRPDDSQLRQKLDPEQYNILVKNETESPYTSEYLNNDQEGIYVDIATGEPLFTTFDQYDASCGWPSFTKPIDAGCLTCKLDVSNNMERMEVRSHVGDFHLGHVFPDGPEEKGGLRYCINGTAIRFIPTKDLEVEGYSYLLSYINSLRQDSKQAKNCKLEKPE